MPLVGQDTGHCTEWLLVPLFAQVASALRSSSELFATTQLLNAKAEPKLAEIQLLKQSRLSLPSITDAEWKFVCKMGGVK